MKKVLGFLMVGLVLGGILCMICYAMGVVYGLLTIFGAVAMTFLLVKGLQLMME